MDQMFVGIIDNLGIAGIGFGFLYLFVNKYFKQVESIVSEIKNLCAEVKDLVASFNELKTVQAAQQEIDRGLSTEIRDTYSKISTQIEFQSQKIEAIENMCIELTSNRRKIPLGNIALSKGYLTKEQLEECLVEQDKLKQ